MKDIPITIQTLINAPVSKVWDCWTYPDHITQWSFASDDWESPYAENDLQVGGKFKTTMAAKDKSAGFDINGVYTEVEEHALIEYDMEDGRHVKVVFNQTPDGTQVVETFDPEEENSREMQQAGWQAILDNFRKYVESTQGE